MKHQWWERCSLVQLVEGVRSLTYGRPSERSVRAMLREGCGTCSTKHMFLLSVLRERFPETNPKLVHRVYTLDQEIARSMFGDRVAKAVPTHGLTDVHRYLTITIDDCSVVIDATFPGARWDGRSSMALACGPGTDYSAGPDPDADKRRLEAEHCDPAVREPFIAALSAVSH